MQLSERTETFALRERQEDTHILYTAPPLHMHLHPLPPAQFPSSWHYPVFLWSYLSIGQTSFETRQAFTNFMSTNQKSLLLLSYCTCYTLIWITCEKTEKQNKKKTIKIFENTMSCPKKSLKLAKKNGRKMHTKKKKYKYTKTKCVLHSYNRL